LIEIISAVNDARVEQRGRSCGHRDQLIRIAYARQTSYGHAKEVNVKIIEVRQSKKFKGAWSAFEAPGVEPGFAEPDAKRKAIDYACQRFGGSSGEVHVYDATGATIERKIIIDGRGQYQKARE
jgi:hypothetical protein